MRTLWQLILTLGLGYLGHVHASSVAVAVDVQGKVSQQSGTASKALNVLDYLPDQVVLQLDKGGEAHLVSLKSSVSWVLKGPGQYRVGTEAIQVLTGKPPMLKKTGGPSNGLLSMESSQRERLALGAVVMRGEAPPVKVLAPLDGPVLNNRPTLYWEASGPVTLTVLQKGTDKPVMEKSLNAGFFRLTQALKPGLYEWRVSPVGQGMQVSVGGFEVMPAQDARRALITTPPSTVFAQRVRRAVELEQAGLTADAWVLWRTLADERPDDENLKAWAK